MRRLARLSLRPTRAFACLLCARPFTTQSASSAPAPSPSSASSPASTQPTPPSPLPLPTRTHSIFRANQFHNPWPSFTEKSIPHRLSDLVRYFAEKGRTRRDAFSPHSYRDRSFPAPYNVPHIDLDFHLPVHTPDFSLIHSLSPSLPPPIAYTWIGHATGVIQLPHLTLLTDPWFSSRASAWQAVGPRRFRPPACPVSALPPLDAVLISHNHFDHLDYGSVKALGKKVEAQERETARPCHWFVPLGMKRWLLRWAGVRDSRCHELDWWKSHEVAASTAGSAATAAYKVTAVGAQHWTSRWALLDNRVQLWCGFVIQAEGASVYYSGDSGYCPVFREIGAHFPPPDLALIPIGAYDPQWLLKGAHVSPADAVQIHCDTQSRQSVAVHWGTVVLSSEMVMEPKILLEEEVRKRGLRSDEFITTEHGKTVILGGSRPSST